MSSKRRQSKKTKQIRRYPGGPGLRWLGPLFVAFVAGALVVYVLISGGHVEPLGVDLTLAQEKMLRQTRVNLLRTMLDSQARWSHLSEAEPLEWEGTLPDSVSLVQWNARVTQSVRDLGFEVLAGREEVIPRAGRWPLQRLTLEIGDAGLLMGRVSVEMPRSPHLPQPF